MPDTTWPINGHPPDLSRDYEDTPVLMSSHSFRHFDSNRLSDPHLTPSRGAFSHIAHHDSLQLTQHVSGLEPPPAGRLRRATPSSSTQHRIKKPDLHQHLLHVLVSLITHFRAVHSRLHH